MSRVLSVFSSKVISSVFCFFLSIGINSDILVRPVSSLFFFQNLREGHGRLEVYVEGRDGIAGIKSSQESALHVLVLSQAFRLLFESLGGIAW